MRSLLLATIFAAAFAAAPGNAAVVFRLDGVSFTDGGKATGTFTTNDTLESITDWKITTTDATDGSGFSGFTYRPGEMLDQAGLVGDVIVFTNGMSHTLQLFLDQPLGRTGGTLLGTGENGPDFALRITPLNSGSIQPVAAAGAVPEPATWAMMIGGVGLVGGALRRRARPTVSVRFA